MSELQEYLKCEKLGIDPSGAFQEQIRNYILENADETLTNKILAPGNQKNIPDCFQFVYNEIRKEYVKAHGQVSGGCAVDPQKVFGLAVHYFDEVDIPKESTSKPVENKPKEPVVTTDNSNSTPISPTELELPKETETKVEKQPKKVTTKIDKLSKKEKDLEQAFGGFTLFG